MDTNIDFKNIWNKQESEIPEVKTLYNMANRFKRNNLYKLIAVNLMLLLTSIFIGFIWYYFQPELVTTKIGIIFTISAMIIFLLPYNRQLSLLFKNKSEPNSKEFLQQFIELKEKQIFQQTTMLSVYFIILSLGIGLYLFEYVLKMTITWGIITYEITTLWILINWFYLRPHAIKKQNAKLNKLLAEFKKLNHQMMD
ncbi:hypothetical protein [Bizionia arctica]|uniref:Uncharacterized protein n=1 Tax=Bizionia arctica TaxID=1495645 RepID=A0A917GX85_9FLAO|nr:hypothetical protein [Bizionia arctica]GGG59718.1 hypothetical protein GCM10010976_33100 [Bizionia arctica]